MIKRPSVIIQLIINIIPIFDEKSIVDVMLGLISTNSGKRDLDSFTVDMKNRGQTTKRIETVRSSLAENSKALVVKVDGSNLPTKNASSRKSSGGKKL